MATKTIGIEDLGEVTFQKRKGTRSIKIHIHGDQVKVTLPHWFPYSQAKTYVLKKKDWILEHKKSTDLLAHGTFVGKKHKIFIEDGSNLRLLVKNDLVRLRLPPGYKIESTQVQAKLRTGTEKALQAEAKELLRPRLNDLSVENDIPYASVKFKKLRARWGSCDSHNNLIFNIYLMQLPWTLIDYVIVHELAHTKEHNHSKNFWLHVENILPDYKQRRKLIKQHDTNIVVS